MPDFFVLTYLSKSWYVCNMTQFYVLNDCESENKYDKVEIEAIFLLETYTTENKLQLD